jgi:hypothetical protein
MEVYQNVIEFHVENERNFVMFLIMDHYLMTNEVKNVEQVDYLLAVLKVVACL